ncbi:MAG: fasciclin domain-containing protein [Planctomycetota bacterium]
MRFKSIPAFVAVAVALLSTTVTAQQNIVETAASAGNFNTLITAAKAAGLAGALSGHDQLTVFAPTDEAFAKVDPGLLETLLRPENKEALAAILKFHVVPGRVSAADAYDLRSAGSLAGQRLQLDFQADAPMIENARIIATDIQCSNGVIHVIDEVMIPALDTIPATAVNAGTFETLVAAVGAAGLVDVLGSEGPFTVFAPTDEAFAALPAGTVETLLQPENRQQLVDILKYHVVAGRVYDNDAVKAGQAETLLGRRVSINFSGEGLTVNESRVVAKNINASNGVIHVIDSVLIPTSMGHREAMDMLNAAVNRGAPIYNAGHHGQCCDIYTQTMTTLMDSGISGADDHTMRMISDTLASARRSHNDTDRAWALRNGIDSLYSRLSSMPMQMSTAPGTYTGGQR